MLTINMISGILNLISNGGLGTHTGTTSGSQNPSNTLGSSGDLGLTQVVSGPASASAASAFGGATTSGGGSNDSPNARPKESGAESGGAAGAQLASAQSSIPVLRANGSEATSSSATSYSEAAYTDINGPVGQVVASSLGETSSPRAADRANRPAGEAPNGEDASGGARVNERTLATLAAKAFAETAASIRTQAKPSTSEGDVETPTAARVTNGAQSQALVAQERLIRADLVAQLNQIAKTRDVGPADALRIMAGQDPQLPLVDPNQAARLS